MAINFKFPDVGEGIHEGKLVKWLVKEGDQIKADGVLAEVETDKAVVEIPSPQSGFILKIYHKEGETIKVGETLATIGEQGDQIPAEEQKPKISQVQQPAPQQTNQQISAQATTYQPAAQSTASIGVIATPSVRLRAKELGVDIDTTRGTGPSGRVTLEDVENATKAEVKSSSGALTSIIMPLQTDFSQFGEVQKIKITGMRKRTSEVMTRSKRTAAQVTHFDEADVSLLAKLREELKPMAAEKGVKITYLPFIVKAVLSALKAHAKFNSSFDEATDEIILKKYLNIGIAVDTPDGLVVPVMHNAEKKDLFEIAAEIARLANEALAGKMKLDDMKGGSFSITNVGSIGGEFFTPIINHPEVAILGIGKISDKVVVDNGKAVIAKKLPLSLSFDHRIIDGAEAARFMNDIIAALENPEIMK
ncbi:MAG: dihydrolipoamide acetyltransferase family protein [Candidatus Micrarchaeota archaeon]